MLPNSHNGHYCTHSAVGALTPEQEDLGRVREWCVLQHCKSTVGYKNSSYLTRKTHIHMRQIHTDPKQ